MALLKRWIGGLPAQLLGTVFVSALGLMIVVALGGISVHSLAMRSVIGARDERTTRTAAVALTERLNGRINLLQTLGAHAVDGAAIERMLADAPVLREAFDYGLLLLDAQGRPVWDWQPVVNWSRHATGITPIQLVRLDELPLIVIGADTADGSYSLLGAFSLTSIDVAGLLSPLRSSDQTVVWLVASDGHILFHSEDLPPPGPVEAIPGVRPALSGESGAMYARDESGQELIVTFSPIALAQWGLIVQEPWEEVASVTLRLSENAPLLLLPAVLLAGLALLFGLWRIVRPLQRLEERASRLAWGDYEAIRSPVGGIPEIGDLQRALIQMAQRVQQAENARQSYIGALTCGQEEERGRLARELHDDTVQALIALGQRLQAVERQLDRDPAAARARLSELRGLVNQTLDDVRRLIRNMRPSYLEDLGLIPAIKALCAETEQLQGFTVSFQYTGPDSRFAPEVEVALYRIVQEALNNVARHAQATHAVVYLKVNEAISLVVQDNGVGFEVPPHPVDFAAQAHFGLLSIAERVRLLGGTLDIHSTVGQGTTLTVRLHL